MGWVKEALGELAAGRAVRVAPQGGRSMAGRVDSGQRVTLVPVAADTAASAVKPGDIVLVLWRGNHILHIVREIDGERALIGKNLGKINGWVPLTDIVARAVAVGD